MNSKLKYFLVLSIMFTWLNLPINTYAEDKHEHSEEAGHKEHSEKEEHKQDHGDDLNDDHGEDTEHDEHGDEQGDVAEHDEHGGGSGIGPGKAILEVANEGNKFKLSNESESFLNIKTAAIESLGENSYRVPKSSIVTYQNSKGIYIKTDNWFEIISIKILKAQDNNYIIAAKNIRTDSKLATKGLGFLRAAHLQASGQGGKGHAH